MGNQPSYGEKTNNQQYDTKFKYHVPRIPLPESMAISQSLSMSIPSTPWPMTRSTSKNTPKLTLNQTSSNSMSVPPLTLKQMASNSLSYLTPSQRLTLQPTSSNSSSWSTITPVPLTPRNINTAEDTKISNEMMQINRMRHKKQDSIHNGIVGVYLSSETVEIAFDFWTQNIPNLNMSDELEIGCSILFGMVSSDIAIKKIFMGNTNCNKLETVSMKFLNMMGYVIRNLLRNDINIYSSLKLLGTLHFKAGVTVKMYGAMLTSMHETFVHYFPDQYTVEVQNAMDDVFNVVVSIMTDRHSDNDLCCYLKCLDKCLASLDGRSALFTYLKQCGCNNIVLFCELLHKFKATSIDMERFRIARDIVRFNIDGIYQSKKLDISRETTENILVEMQQMDALWLENIPIYMDNAFFDEVECEVNELISRRYWKAFKQSIRVLQESL